MENEVGGELDARLEKTKDALAPRPSPGIRFVGRLSTVIAIIQHIYDANTCPSPN